MDRAGILARLKQIAPAACDRTVGLVLEKILVDGCITKTPGGGQCAAHSPTDRGKPGMKRSAMTDGYGVPLGRWPGQPTWEDAFAAALESIGLSAT